MIIYFYTQLLILTYSFSYSFITKTSYRSNFKLNNEINTNTQQLIDNNILQPTSPIDTLFPNRITPRNGQSSFFEEDINFCLRETDTAMSALSRSKILNEITNNVMKALLIGYEPIILQLSTLYEGYREQIDKAECVYDESEVLENVCASITIEECDIKWKQGSKNDFCMRDLLMARIYLDRLSSLLLQGFTQDAVLGGKCMSMCLTITIVYSIILVV